MPNAPKVMISSTFYDLKQIRANLVDFLTDDLSFIPLVSELNSFPIDPDVDSIENCRRRVEEDADILVLIIGGRYGAIDSASAKSVTNLEYLAARAKGIPIYAFVEKTVLALLPVWKNNPDDDFSPSVDDPRLFEFIVEVRETEKVWTTEFEYANDIIDNLRRQFSYLTKNSVVWSRRLRQSEEKVALDRLSGTALRTALERPPSWEFKLLGHALADEVAARAELRNRHRLRLPHGEHELVDDSNFDDWRQRRFAELTGMAKSIHILVNEAFPLAMGAPGQPGSMDRLVYLAHDFGKIYEDALEWALRVLRVTGDEDLRALAEAMFEFSETFIKNTENIHAQILNGVAEAESTARPEDLPVNVEVTIDLEAPPQLEEFVRRAKQLRWR